MSFLKQLLKPFVEFDEKTNAAVQPQSRPVTVTKQPDVVKGSVVNQPAQHPLIDPFKPVLPDIDNTPVPSYSPSGILKDPLSEHKQYFEKLIDEANKNDPFFKGVDYKEFVDQKIDIDEISDETLKYQTAFNILTASGLTKQKLANSAQEYLNIIGRDLNSFQGAHNQQFKKELSLKQASVQKKVEELQLLTSKVNALKAEINQLTQGMNMVREKLDTTRNSFLLAGERKQEEIKNELKKIDKYFQ